MNRLWPVVVAFALGGLLCLEGCRSAPIFASDVETAVPLAAPTPEYMAATAVINAAQVYLENEFCRGGLCNDGEWRSWIINDEGSDWQVAELVMAHDALLTTLYALNDVGIDGQSLLAGYRLRKLNQDYVRVESDWRQLAAVRHAAQEIVLSRSAFLRQQGFCIYHELGHVVDERVGQAYTINYQKLASAHGEPSEAPIADGYWLNAYGRDHANEGGADAFATWIALQYAGNRRPVFPGTPVSTNYELIADAARTALIQAVLAGGDD